MSGGIPLPSSVTVNRISLPLRAAARSIEWPGVEKPIAFERRLKRICRIRLPSATNDPMPSAAATRRVSEDFAEAVLDAFRRGLHGLRDVDLLERQFHGVRVDRGEIENVVDNGEKRVGRLHYIASVFTLFGIERAGRGIVKKLNEADNIGQRRAQLVRDMVDEVIAQSFSVAQRLIAVAQRLVAFRQGAFDIHAGGRVDEGEKGRTIGERRGSAIEHRPITARETPFEPHPLVRQSRDGGAQRRPSFLVGKQRSA